MHICVRGRKKETIAQGHCRILKDFSFLFFFFLMNIEPDVANDKILALINLESFPANSYFLLTKLFHSSDYKCSNCCLTPTPMILVKLIRV